MEYTLIIPDYWKIWILLDILGFAMANTLRANRFPFVNLSYGLKGQL